MADFLDERQRAMLAEMGVTVWRRAPAPSDSPVATVAFASSPQRQGANPTMPVKVSAASTERLTSPPARLNNSSAKTSETSSRVMRESRGMASPAAMTDWADLANLDWLQLQDAVNHCQDCGLCASRQASVWGHSLGLSSQAEVPLHPTVLVITDPPDDADEASGQPLGGEGSAAGSLLNAMLQAAGWLSDEHSSGVFLTPVTKCKVPAGYKLTDTELRACRRYLAQQIKLLQPQLILTLGRVAAQSMLAPLQEGHPTQALGQLRGKVHEVQGHAMVASLAPQYLLRNPLEKAKAWDDLCLALSHLSKGAEAG